MKTLLVVGLVLLCGAVAPAAQAMPAAAQEARDAIRTALPQERAQLQGVRAELKSGALSPAESHQLVLQIRAAIAASRHH